MWVYCGEPGVIVLQHEYPDFHPTTGWGVEVEGQRKTIRSTDGRSLFIA